MQKINISKSELEQKITQTILEVAKIAIKPSEYNTNLFTLGLDSLKAIQVVNILEDDLDIMIDDSNLQKFTSINVITEFFLSQN